MVVPINAIDKAIEIEIFGNNKNNNIFLTGQTLNGAIKYNFQKDKTLNEIVISLKGRGKLHIYDKWRRTNRDKYGYEIYENIKDTALHSVEGTTILQGLYKYNFSIDIPNAIPPSFIFYRNNIRYRIKCRINHFIVVKFIRNGLLGETVKVKKEIFIISGADATVGMRCNPIIYGAQKKLISMIGFKEKLINLKAQIDKSVIKPGDEIKLAYELTNESNLNIVTIRVKLLEVYKFNKSLKIRRKIPGKDVIILQRSGRIRRRTNYNNEVVTSIPITASCVNFSEIVSRNYYVYFIVVLPCLRRNLILKVPVQVDPTLDGFVLDDKDEKFIDDFINKLHIKD